MKPRTAVSSLPQYDEELMKEAEAADRQPASGFERRARHRINTSRLNDGGGPQRPLFQLQCTRATGSFAEARRRYEVDMNWQSFVPANIAPPHHRRGSIPLHANARC